MTVVVVVVAAAVVVITAAAAAAAAAVLNAKQGKQTKRRKSNLHINFISVI